MIEMNFYINHIDDTSIQGTQKVLPVLCMMLVCDGRHDFHKFHDMIEDAEVTFSMKDVENGVYKVVNGKAFVKQVCEECCEKQHLVCYQFTKREVDKPGRYVGKFTIRFNDDLKNDECEYPDGVLVVPIRDELNIIVR